MIVQEITTVAELAGLAGEWESLWRSVPSATPFQSPAWLIPWWRHIGQGDLWTLAIREHPAGLLQGLLPLYLYTHHDTQRRDLFLLGIATTDYLDVLVAPGQEQPVLQCALSYLQDHGDRWDACDFQQLPDGSPLRQRPIPAASQGRFSEGEPCPVLALPQAPDELPIPWNMLQNLRYYRRRASRAAASIETADGQSADEMTEALFALHAARWQTRSEAGVLSDAAVQQAHRESIPLLLQAGLLRMYGLRVDGRIAAVFYGLADPIRPGSSPRKVYYYLGGFDPAHQALSPGGLLIGHAIEQARADGAALFDFLRGQEPYKYLWGAHDTYPARWQWWPDRPSALTTAQGGTACLK